MMIVLVMFYSAGQAGFLCYGDCRELLVHRCMIHDTDIGMIFNGKVCDASSALSRS